jgi:lycopene cyclase domain-containing protein
MSLYLWLNFLTLLIPLIATFDKRINFHKTWRALLPALLFTALIFIIWDIYFTEQGIWGFNADYLTGVYLFGLPLEEWLFFFAIPYACVFTYFCIKKLIPKKPATNRYKIFTFVLTSLLLVTGILNTDRLYTSVTFFFTGLFLLLHLYFFKMNYLKDFYLSYAAIYILPFVLVNGALTGLFTEQAIVWYNNEENLGMRIFTIPLEDYIYGFLLQLINISIFEWILSKKRVAL